MSTSPERAALDELRGQVRVAFAKLMDLIDARLSVLERDARGAGSLSSDEKYLEQLEQAGYRRGHADGEAKGRRDCEQGRCAGYMRGVREALTWSPKP